MMAVIKCKMCGGDLKVVEGESVCECEYCGSRQTVPSADNEKKMTLFSRASRLLRNCEFDKAAGVFESIVADFPEEAEAYWGLVLCKYGIEYVDDPATGKKIPTCHRSSFESVEDDVNYEQACENADAVARRVYREEARQIEVLRKRILEVSGKEEPYDIFISYKELDGDGERTPDSVIAQDIYKALSNEGYRVFFSRISLEGKLGIEYEPYIFAALNSAKVMIVVGTDYEYFDAVWVKNEWSRFLKLIASGQKKTMIPVYKDMDPYDMPKELRNLAAQNMGKIGAMQDLIHGVEKLLGKKSDEVLNATTEKPVTAQIGGPNVTALLDRGNMALEDGEWEQATKFYDQVLNMDSRCAEAYIGLAKAEAHCENNASFEKIYKQINSSLRDNRHVTRAKKFADPSITEWFSRMDAERKMEEERAKLIKLQELQEEKEKAKEWQYNKALAMLAQKERYPEKLSEAEVIFYELGSYRDAPKKAEKCTELIKERNKKIEEDQEREFQDAVQLLTNANSIDEYVNAKDHFVHLQPYRNMECRKHIEECEKGISELLCKEVEKRKTNEINNPPVAPVSYVAKNKEKPSVLRRALHEEKDSLQAELRNLKGLFSGRRRREIEARLLEIEKELLKT